MISYVKTVGSAQTIHPTPYHVYPAAMVGARACMAASTYAISIRRAQCRGRTRSASFEREVQLVLDYWHLSMPEHIAPRTR